MNYAFISMSPALLLCDKIYEMDTNKKIHFLKYVFCMFSFEMAIDKFLNFPNW